MPTVSLSELKNMVYSKLEQNTRMYPEAVDLINEGIKLTNLMGGWFTNTEPVRQYTTIANRCIYKVPDNIVIPEKVSFEGRELDKVGLFQLCHSWPNWMTDTTRNGSIVTRWCPYALNRFIINPADAVGGGYLEVTGIGTPDDLVDDTDTIHIPKEGVTAVAEYAAHGLQCKLTGAPFTQSIPMYKTYEKYAKSQKLWLTFKQPNIWYDINKPD